MRPGFPGLQKFTVCVLDAAQLQGGLSMSVFDVLQERGFIKQMSHEEEIKELLDTF